MVINQRRQIHIETINFKNGNSMENKTAQIVDRFLIVWEGEDIAPSWYTLDTIESLEHVTPLYLRPEA